MKIYRHDNKIVSLTNVQSVELISTERTATRNGKRTNIIDCTIRIEYFNSSTNNSFYFKENHVAEAQQVLNDIQKILSEE